MFDKEIIIGELIALGIKRDLSETENAVLQDWLDSDPENAKLYGQLMQQELVKHKMVVFAEADRERVWNKVMDGVAKLPESRPASGKKIVWPWVAVAASVILVLGVGLLYYQRQAVRPPVAAVNDLAPGGTGAVLTLANGTRISLAAIKKGKLAVENGVRISKSNDGKLVYEVDGQDDSSLNSVNTLSTGKGEIYEVSLPDRTKVWLNSSSSLTYNSNFSAGRTVRLSGEAYFEVTKDKNHPFVVETGNQDVKVLGTHFNISAYAEEKAIKTTLLEGLVQVSQNTGKMAKGTILKPGQQSVLNSAGIDIKQVDAESAIDWKNGYFDFDNEPIESIMRKIGRWYGAEVYYADDSIMRETFTGSISRYEKVSKVLQLLERTGVLSFKLHKNTITVLKK